MQTEALVASHYSRSNLEQAILEALVASGKDPEHLSPADLAGADQFHLGWHGAAVAFADDLGLGDGIDVLDIGSGIGGPARLFAERGCRVVGIDLTPDFVDTATGLTRRTGLADRVAFRVASAAAMPFDDDRFDAAALIHVGMNIPDKAAVFAETRRVLKPGGRFGVYDVMRVGSAELTYPLPWAETPAASFVETPATYRRLLADAGFAIESEVDRGPETQRLAAEMRERTARQGPSPMGLHILMGPATPVRMGNIFEALQRGIVAPIQIIARAT